MVRRGQLKMQKIMRQNQHELSQKKQAERLVRRFILTQLMTTLVLSAALLIYDYTAAYSALAGGMIATLANAWFAIKVFQVKSEETPETVLTTFYVGEIYKFVFTGAMFVIAFVLIKPLSIVAFMGLYFLIHMTPAVVNVLAKETLMK
jgi:ATP synthase protein I